MDWKLDFKSGPMLSPLELGWKQSCWEMPFQAFKARFLEEMKESEAEK